jgi:hypothetical protein
MWVSPNSSEKKVHVKKPQTEHGVYLVQCRPLQLCYPDLSVHLWDIVHHRRSCDCVPTVIDAPALSPDTTADMLKSTHTSSKPLPASTNSTISYEAPREIQDRRNYPPHSPFGRSSAWPVFAHRGRLGCVHSRPHQSLHPTLLHGHMQSHSLRSLNEIPCKGQSLLVFNRSFTLIAIFCHNIIELLFTSQCCDPRLLVCTHFHSLQAAYISMSAHCISYYAHGCFQENPFPGTWIIAQDDAAYSSV